MMRFHLLFYVLFFTFYVLISPTSAQVRFTDVTDVSGLGDFTAVYTTWGDYDSDGNMDVVLLGSTGRRLYRNEGNGRFVDVTKKVGITTPPIRPVAAIFGDFDNNGNLDLFIDGGNGGGNVNTYVLYRNREDGTFLDVSQEAGIIPRQGSFGAISFDYDNDGLLDIYVSTSPPSLYHNEGNLRFVEVASQIGLDKPRFGFLGLGDYDNDGDLDIFLTSPQNVLYRNDGGGRFIDVTMEAGVPGGNQGPFFWDYDNDGDLDLLFVADRQLYRNNGNGTFTDVTLEAGIRSSDFSWGAHYGDYDNDGWLDLCITDRIGVLPTLLYHNNGNGTFTEVSQEAGIFVPPGISGSVNFVDYDNDGDLDIYIGTLTPPGRAFLYQNNGTGNHWLKLKLIGSKSNRDAIGARIKLKAGELSLIGEIAGSSGRGPHQHRLPVHFGLGKNTKVDLIEIRWPSGIIQTFTNIPADQQLTIDEIEGEIVSIYGLFPIFVDPKGSTPVLIQGEGFIVGSRVFFGGIEARDVKVESPSLITAITPPGIAGFVDVEVIRPNGQRGILKNGFRYTTIKVAKINPEVGSITGGITIQIEGVGFQQGAEVQIGGRRLTNLFVTPVLIRGTLPPRVAGVVDIAVINPTGERDILPRAFTYISPPTIESVSPIFVPANPSLLKITIKGSGFIDIPSVRIGNADLSVEFVTSNELRISKPPTGISFLEIGPQDVVVINPDGQRAVLPSGVTVLAPIKIKSVEPTSGGLEGGTKITIVGEPTVEIFGSKYPSRFVERAEVFVGKEPASEVKVISDHIITAITPPNTPGPKIVEVINPDGFSTRLAGIDNAATFTYNPLPQITKVIPNNGPLAGGTKITIQGSKFLPGAKVLIGDVDANSYIVASAPEVASDAFITAITPKVPLDEPGPRDVIVVNPDGQEVVLRDGFTYNPLPTIRDISPSYGPSSGGTKVILRGTGFLQGARVIIGKRPATTEFKDDSTIEAVTPANPKGRLDVKVRNLDTQEAIIPGAFVSVGELAYNYPNPFQASRGTTFRYVPGPNETVESIEVRIFNLAGVPIGVVGAEGSNEVRWQDSRVNVGLYVYMMEVKVGGKVKRFKRALEVYK